MKRVMTALTIIVAGLLVIAPSAFGSFHEIKVREVYPGSTAAPTADYVELQMWADFQNLVSGGNLRVYNSDGTTAHDVGVGNVPDVANSQNQRTILIGGPGYAAAFPAEPANATDAALSLDPAGGAVCWPINSAPIDCVSWGNFTGAMFAQPAPNTNAPFLGSGPSNAIADGKAIRRSIAGSCPTFLEDGDDTNSNPANFSEQTPFPRNNAHAVLETPCTGPPGSGGTTTTTTTPVTTTPPPAVTKKKCKKGFKLKRGKCRKKK